MKFERRFDTPLYVRILVPLVSLIAAFVVSGMFMFFTGIPPLQALKEMISSAFMDSYGLSESLTKAIPLALCSIGLIICYRMILWNIGAQGQAIMGALATVGMLQWINFPSIWIALPTLALIGCLAGGCWGAIAGFLKARWNVNEIISTLMLNYIALNLKDFFVFGPWRDPSSLGFPMTKSFPPCAQLPLIGFGRVDSSIFLAILLAVIFHWLLSRSRWGYEIRVLGESQQAAKFAGINAVRMTVLSLFISGALCGLAGMVTMTGLEHRLQGGFNAAFGSTAIIVAWLANLNPILALFVSFLMGGLLVGGESLQITLNLPVAGTLVIQGLILIFLVAGQFFTHYRILRKEKD